MASNNRYYSSEPYNKRDRRSYSGVASKPHSRWPQNNRIELDLKQSRPNNILRLTVLNPQYQVTTEILHYAFSFYGNVVRIVLFERKSIPMAMVEYDTVPGKESFWNLESSSNCSFPSIYSCCSCTWLFKWIRLVLELQQATDWVRLDNKVSCCKQWHLQVVGLHKSRLLQPTIPIFVQRFWILTDVIWKLLPALWLTTNVLQSTCWALFQRSIHGWVFELALERAKRSVIYRTWL